MGSGIFRFVKFGVVLLFAAAAALTAASCSDSSTSTDLGNRLERAVDEAMSAYGIPGAIVGVWRPGYGETILVKGKGDVETGADVEIGERVRICSITKTFTVTVVLQLVDEGRLGLEDRLAGFYPDIPGADRITIRQLCDMTSGLFSYDEDEMFIRTFTGDPDKVWEPAELVALAVAHPPYFPPGEGWHYSNTNAIILGMIVEKITGKDIASEIRSRLVDGLTLTDTCYPEGTGIEGPHMHGYVGGEGEELTDATYLFNPSGMGASGAMISSLFDMKAWVTALADGDLLTDETQSQRTTFVPGDYAYFGIPVKYGLGVLSCRGFLGHPGDGFGYTNAAFHSPETGAIIVVFLNKAPNEGAFMALTLFEKLAEILNDENLG